MTGRAALGWLLALAAACGGGAGDQTDGGGDGGDDPGGSDALFARDLIEVSIEMDPAAWDELRHQAKSRHGQYGRPDCRDAPAPNPYTWFAATVTIDGEELPFTGVRKKGNIGSQSTLIPSLKLRFDEYVDGQALRGLDRMALNNSKADPSYARTCLGYAVFAAAGIPAPRCTLAHVVVNGEDLGPYVAIDEVAEQFLARHFERPDGNLYEGTACDFRDDAIGGFEQETNQDSDPGRADLLAVMAALEADDASLRAELDRVVDVDRFIEYWAVESLIWHRDGYGGNANNYFVYADPADGGRLRFLPWGPDAAFRVDNRDQVPDSVLAYGVLANRLYAIPAERQRYYDQMAKLLANHWKPARLVEEAERIAAIARPLLPAAARAEHDADLAELISFLRGRREVLEGIAAGVYPDWTDGLRVLPCLTPLGPVSGTFATTWDTLAMPAADAGSATIALELDGAPVVPEQDGARAGDTADGLHRIQLIFDLAGGERMTLTTNIGDGRWFEPYLVPGEHRLTQPPAPMSLVHQDVSGSPAVTLGRYDIGAGTLTFEAVDPTPGGVVRGSFQATLYQGL